MTEDDARCGTTMSEIAIIVLAVAALLLVFGLVKKLVKLVFSAGLLLLIAAAIWYFLQ